ncbi:lipase 3-like [Nymphalis io]|uniref:lipase 3-like n=1 Tax=Inachis io TaxID=171585 RepID=UPI00216790E6|nr:lipase 3-like [Nymphalis io]
MKLIIIFLSISMVGLSLLTCRDMPMNFIEIANELGYSVREYDVVTQDGYILKLFHIPGDRSRPVLLMHGLVDSADTFILRRDTSLCIALANAGYDVWIGNNRGNKYSRRHQYLDPDSDKEFWDYSFHELGYYDLPAIIDFVLDNTGAKSLSAIGHSQGNSIFLVLGATRPEYNEKIKVLVSLSPICFLNNMKKSASRLLKLFPVIVQFFTITGQVEILGENTVFARIFRYICGTKNSYGFCAHGIFFRLAGNDPEELEADFYPTVVAYYPTGTSKKNVVHLSQVSIRRTFAEFDYGLRNFDIYNSTVSPEYDLSKVKMKVALLAGRNDYISTIKDVLLLRSKLPNVIEYTVVKHKKFNHIDGVWGRNMNVYLFPSIFDILSKHG